MVSTRHHPSEFPEPATPTHTTPSTPPPKSPTTSTAVAKSPSKSPSKRKPSTSTAVSSTAPTLPLPPPAPATKSVSSTSTAGYTHTPSKIIFWWLLVSLPLVAWDTLYVMLRPHTMPGGRLHSPLWTPYALYGTIDYMYGWPAWNNKIGFTGAQASLNVLESICYLYYAWVVGVVVGSPGAKGLFLPNEPVPKVRGKYVALAVLVCWAAAIMTVSKTVLYGFNEAFSNFENIGHNAWPQLLVLWVIPNGAWIVLPSYALWVLGKEILATLDHSGAAAKKVR